MEARSSYSGSWSSKSLVAVIAVVATMGLGVTAGVVAKNLNGSAAPQTHKIAQGLGGAAQENPARRGGVQIVAGGASSGSTAVGPDDRPSTAPSAAPFGEPAARGMRIAAHI